MDRRILHLRKAIDANPVPMLDAMSELVDALLQAGDRVGAISAYRSFEARFPVPVANSTRLREAYERALWSESASLPTNLPVPRNLFVGRHAEMAAVADAVLRNRFTCLVGPGGIGKTRIALQSARTWISRFHDGVWWIDCSSISGELGLLTHIARAMRFEDRRYTQSSLLERIGESNAAIVLDCCEDSPEDTAGFAAAALAQCPNLTILATSRVPLDGAEIVAIAPLPLAAGMQVKRADVIASDAARLFVELAVSADPQFVLTDENAQMIAQICRDVDGVPLAIELAAAYLAHANLAEVHERLTRRTIDDLNRTVARTIDWAYRWLSEFDAAVLRAMSVFPGIWTLDDALGMGATRESIDRLTGTSLVLSERSESGLTRYRLLDTTRAFMRDRLREFDEWDVTLERFVRHMVGVAQTYVKNLERLDGKSPLQLQDRYESISFAVDLGASNAAFASSAIEIIGTIGIGLGMLGFAGDFGARAAAAIQSVRGTGVEKTPDFDRALRALGWLANRRGEYQEALALNQELIERARASGDMQALARNLGLAVVIYCNAGKFDEGLLVAQEGITLSRQAGDVQSLSVALRGIASVYLTLGRGADALEPMQEFVALPSDGIPKMQQAMGMCDYASALHAVGRHEDARTWFERAIALCMQNRDYGTATHANANLAEVYAALGDMRSAHAAGREAVRLSSNNINALTKVLAFEELVGASIRDDQVEQLAFLLGYTDEVRRRRGVSIAPERAPRSGAMRTAVSQRMSKIAYDRAVAKGAAASLEQAIQVAMELKAGDVPLDKADRFGALTRREREVADLAVRGMTNRAIADQLCLSMRTVDVHVASILRKLGVERREQIAR
jgi:non-specific serine/threonine protein kinase